MEDVVIPYELPETENHSFFFIDQHIDTRLEAKLHRHDAWELYYVVQGRGARMAGDTLLPFTEGNVTLIPPSMHHQNGWIGRIRKVMRNVPVASHPLHGIRLHIRRQTHADRT